MTTFENTKESRIIQALAMHTRDAFLITKAEPYNDPDGPEVIYVNAAFTEMTGYTPEDIIGKTPRILQGDDTDRSELDRIRAALESWSPVRVTLKNYTKDGQAVWVEIDIVPIADENGWFIYWASIQRDITQRVEDEQKLRDALVAVEKASAAKSEFLSSMSHELRTPLNAILGYGQLLTLNSKDPLNPKKQSFVENLINSGEHLLELIDQVLDLAQIESGRLLLSGEEIELKEMCDECVNLMRIIATDLGLSIDCEYTTTKTIKVDQTRFKQILLNLLSNAVKYNRANGSVLLKVSNMPGDRLRISIIDSGVGITGDKHAVLFEPFNRLGQEVSDIKGTGIGLTITKQLVEAMGGEIGFESEVGKGSTFWIEFPSIEPGLLDDVSASDLVADIQVDAKQQKDATVLYIEDQPANLQLMESIFDEIGNLSLISTHNAELGIVIAEERRPDLILMDINLPGMDGFAALNALKANAITKDIPVIAVSAAATKRDIEVGEVSRFEKYLTKPFDVNELIHAIKEQLS